MKSHVQPANFLKVIWRELLWAATSAREALKHSEIVYLLCKFHWFACSQSLAGYSVLKSLKINYLVTSNVRFGTVSINPVTYTYRKLIPGAKTSSFYICVVTVKALGWSHMLSHTVLKGKMLTIQITASQHCPEER